MSNVKDVDTVKELADAMREKKGVPWSVAKLEVDGESTYVEFFRGKDFARHCKANPEKLNILGSAQKTGKSIDDQVSDFIQILMRRKLVRKTERKYKKPKPGKKRLVKYPKTLEPHSDPNGWTEEAFYAWTYDRPTSMWYYVGTIALPFLVIAACLFPLAPWWMRMTLVYTLMVLLAVLLGTISFRYVLFGAVWVLTGHSFWLFPNLMSDEVSVLDAFSPVISYSKPDKKEKRQWLARLATLLLGVGVVFLLYQHSPDAEHLKENAKKAHDSFLEYLDVYGKNKGLLEGNVNATAANATAQNTAAGGTPGGPGAQQQKPGSGGKPKSDKEL